jgi:3'-phosphoadenosine 5'-phosphosulfate sulfotransferase (PAPS reductase)/FAD synthetase
MAQVTRLIGKTPPAINLHEYDLVIVNSSAGKDSLAALWDIVCKAKHQAYPKKQIVVSHQCLSDSEWEGTRDLAKQQADLFGFSFHVSKRRDKDGYEETLLEYAERRGKWPSSKQRWCTSDFKRGPGARVVTKLTKGMMAGLKVLYVFGFRAQESPSRKKKEPLAINKGLTTKSREVWDYLPIHDWSEKKVWETIHANKLPYHKAYDYGMPRLSCVFCIFAPFDALVIAGIHNPELLDKYIGVEQRTGHDFKQQHSLQDVRDAIEKGYKPKTIANWKM